MENWCSDLLKRANIHRNAALNYDKDSTRFYRWLQTLTVVPLFRPPPTYLLITIWTKYCKFRYIYNSTNSLLPQIFSHFSCNLAQLSLYFPFPFLKNVFDRLPFVANGFLSLPFLLSSSTFPGSSDLFLMMKCTLCWDMIFVKTKYLVNNFLGMT